MGHKLEYELIPTWTFANKWESKWSGKFPITITKQVHSVRDEHFSPAESNRRTGSDLYVHGYNSSIGSFKTGIILIVQLKLGVLLCCKWFYHNANISIFQLTPRTGSTCEHPAYLPPLPDGWI